MKKIRTERVRKHIGLKVLAAIVVAVLCVDILCVLYNYYNFIRVNQQYMQSLAETMTNTCNLVIDGDSARTYYKERKRDSAYYETWNKLIDYRNTNSDIMDLCVVHFDEDGAHYIFDTDLTDRGAFLGDVCDFDSFQIPYKSKLIECQEVLTLEYPTHSDIYMPICTSYNVPVAYVIVGISNVRNNEEQQDYLVKLLIMMSMIMAVFGIFLEVFLRQHVIRHINTLAKAAASYGEDRIAIMDSPLQQINLKTGDELEHLLDSMKKMEHDIVAASTELVVATWNSQHDSMTRMCNKGFFQDTMELWKDYTSVGIIYFDIDNLKRMNDEYGHERGDEVIVETSNFVQKYKENEMVCCRIGGDEFVLLIPEISEEKLDDLVKRMREDPQSYLATWCTDFVCRIAIGGASQKKGDTIQDVVKRAETEMYKNKHVRR